MMQDYISIDLETTGLNPKKDRIIEIGAVKVKNGRCEGTFQTFVNPRRSIRPEITLLTGISDEDIKAAPVMDEILPELLAFMEELPLLGHSILFDYSFLKKAAVDRKLSLERKGVDTLKIARKYLPELESRSLEYLCRYYKIPHDAHRALADAEATEQLYHILEGLFGDADEPLFVPSPLIFKVKRDQPATKAQKERLYRLVNQHKIVLNEEIEGLSRSEASRLTDRLLSAYRDV